MSERERGREGKREGGREGGREGESMRVKVECLWKECVLLSLSTEPM